MDITINGTPAKSFDLWTVGDHHTVIKDVTDNGFRVSYVTYSGTGTMTLTPLDDPDFITLSDAVQAIRHDRQARGLPAL
jgi:hypothetical protein